MVDVFMLKNYPAKIRVVKEMVFTLALLRDKK